jgi:excisionase family DNA binding protein
VRADHATLNLLRWCVDLADGLLGRDWPNHPARDALPDARDWLDTAISRTRNRDADPLPELEPTERIGTAEAANILQLSQRRVQQKIRDGDLKAEKIGRSYFLNRTDIA